MFARVTRVAAITVSLSLLLVSTIAAPARSGGTEWVFPGGCPDGNTSLQECIDDAAAGDGILIQTNGPIAPSPSGSIHIAKSLSLRAAAGFEPLIDGGLRIAESSVPTTVFVSGVTTAFEIGVDLDTSAGSASGHVVTIDDVVANGFNAGRAAVHFDLRVSATVEVRNSILVMNGFYPGAFANVLHASGQSTVRIIGNRVFSQGTDDHAGGIQVNTSAQGPTRADIYSNTVFNAPRCFPPPDPPPPDPTCAAHAGINLFASSDALSHFNVVGNTVHRSRTDALRLFNQQDEGTAVTLNVFDNIFSRAHDSAIDLENLNPDTPLVFRAGYNDFFDNGDPNVLDGHSIGTGNLFAAPRFVDAAAGDFRLRQTSPLIDRGLVCNAGGLENLDAAGHARLAGTSVDMGAYERGAGAPTGVVFLGTSGSDSHSGTAGADILCGFGGPDNLFGEGGGDFIDGGKGTDLLFGEGGPDRLRGGAADDTLCARDQVGNDFLDGGAGSDGYRADPGDTRVNVEHLGSCSAG